MDKLIEKELRTLLEFIAFTEASGGDTEPEYDEAILWVRKKISEAYVKGVKDGFKEAIDKVKSINF